MISEKDVEHIAKLARLGLKPAEIRKFQRDLSSIFGYIKILKRLDVSDVNPMSHSVNLKNVAREDRARPEFLDRVNKLMEAVPDRAEGYIKVKSVL